MRDPHRLRAPRLTAVKAMVPERVKRAPKDWQARAMTAAARRLRADASPSDGLLVTSTPRAGSTWLFEMLASDPEVLPLFEPFHPSQNPRFRRFADAVGYLAVPEAPDDCAVLSELVHEVYAGRELTRWSSNRAPLGRIRHARRTLVKEVRVSRALGWLAETAPVPTVLLVRHPCAVVDSMMRSNEEWGRWRHSEVSAVVRASLGDNGPSPVVPKDRPAFLAALWAADVRCAFDALRGRTDSVVVAYEDLVTEPDAELRRLGALLDLRTAGADPRRPSVTTLKSSPLQRGGDPLTSWRDRLAPSTVDAIVDTVHRLGVTFYTDDPRAERDALTKALA